MAEKRRIFEEVSEPQVAAVAAAAGRIDAGNASARRAVRLWLVALFLMVVAMIAVGGLTRLTDSGLSITEWKPVTGALPPMSDAAWAEEFAKYQASPEYKLQNKGMDLSAFKAIFWWEWGHRLLGRAVGLVWALGFAALTLTRRVPPGWAPRLWLVGLLGGLQGVVGWWMVSSGLEGARVDVASYRLATHLGLAFIILGVIAAQVLELGRREADLLQSARAAERGPKAMATGLMHLAFVQVILGALVAGIDAGRGFPTWPDMNGSFFPADAFYVPGGGALWQAFFENPGLVQFVHRTVAYLLLALGLWAWWRARRSPHRTTRAAFGAVLLMLLAQAGLGIATALSAAALPLAITHQIGAVLLWVLIHRARHLSRFPVSASIREGSR